MDLKRNCDMKQNQHIYKPTKIEQATEILTNKTTFYKSKL